MKPKLKKDNENGIWTAYYISETKQEYKTVGHTPAEAVNAFYKRFGKKLGVKRKGGQGGRG